MEVALGGCVAVLDYGVTEEVECDVWSFDYFWWDHHPIPRTEHQCVFPCATPGDLRDLFVDMADLGDLLATRKERLYFFFRYDEEPVTLELLDLNEDTVLLEILCVLPLEALLRRTKVQKYVIVTQRSKEWDLPYLGVRDAVCGQGPVEVLLYWWVHQFTLRCTHHTKS